MPYASPADLIARFGEEELIDRTDRDQTGAYDPASVARAIGDASALIDGYVAARYTLPLASPPAVLVGVCCDLVRYALWSDAAPGIVEKRRDQALAVLRDIGSGRARLDVPTPAAAPSGTVQAVSGERLFARGAR